MAQINEIKLGFKSNICWYDNANPVIDYYPSVSGTMTELIQYIKEEGAKTIKVKTSNNKIPVEKRLKQICKKCGYTFINSSYLHTYASGVQKFFIEYDLIKI